MKILVLITMGTGLAVSAVSVRAQASNDQMHLEIRSQPLRDALNDWARQTGYQLISPTSEVTSRFIVRTIEGSMSPKAALQRLLADTPLTFQWLDEKTVAIRKRSPLSISAAGRQVNEDDF